MVKPPIDSSAIPPSRCKAQPRSPTVLSLMIGASISIVTFKQLPELKPVWTTFDLLMTENYNPAQQREYLTTMRRASLGFVPILVEELTSSIEQAAISDGNLVESAELKAMRESLLVARMSNGLQLPKEHVWLDNLIRSFIEAIKLQWHE